MKTVAIIEGFAGGPRSTKNFRRALVKAGFKITKDRRAADIIIGHSAGNYGIPFDARANILMLIGPTFWPGRNLIKRVVRHNIDSGRYYLNKYGWRYYAKKKFREVYYFFVRHKYMWLGILHNNKLEHIEALAKKPGRKIFIVRNDSDPFATPEIVKYFPKHKNVEFISLPGVHDDYYSNPKPYIDLLLKEL